MKMEHPFTKSVEQTLMDAVCALRVLGYWHRADAVKEVLEEQQRAREYRNSHSID